jgi:membrane associated rhomboid family serine protease
MTKIVKSIVIINIIGFIITSVFNYDLYSLFALFNIEHPNYKTYQWVTHIFLHASFTHILFNMIALISFGPMVERYLDNRFLLFYIISGIGAAFIQSFFSPINSVLVGASGSIFGVLLLATIIEPDSKVLLFFFIPIKAKWLIPSVLIIESYLGIFGQNDGIGHMAHVGGALTGLLFYLISKRVKK